MASVLPLALATALLSAQVPTFVLVRPPPEDATTPYALRYSQAVLVRAVVVDGDGPVAGERVEISLVDDETGAAFLVDDPVTDPTGVATARLSFVDGRYGGQTFATAIPDEERLGRPYTVRAVFAGDLDADDPACAADAGVVDAGALRCGSADEHPLFLAPENVAIAIQPGNTVALGEELTVAARLEDENGDAPAAGTDVDGSAAKVIAGAEIAFFFDLNGNERPEAGELLGRADTDANGVARLPFTVDPTIFPAGDFEQGLHVQFSGDARYALAGAAGRITIETSAPVPSRTVIEAEPAEVPADGISRIALTAILVDEGGNPLGPEAPPHTVSFTSTLGTILEAEAELDVLSGQYTQELRAPEQGGEATVTVIVDGEEGATRTVTFTDDGCACTSCDPRALPFAILALLPALVVARRPLRRRGTR